MYFSFLETIVSVGFFCHWRTFSLTLFQAVSIYKLEVARQSMRRVRKPTVSLPNALVISQENERDEKFMNARM